MRKKTSKTAKTPLQIPKHWALFLTMIMPLLSPTTAPTTTMTTTMATTTTTTVLTTHQLAARLSLWSALLVPYRKGDIVIYNGIRYRCVTPHRSYAGAEPSPLTWALWRRI